MGDVASRSLLAAGLTTGWATLNVTVHITPNTSCHPAALLASLSSSRRLVAEREWRPLASTDKLPSMHHCGSGPRRVHPSRRQLMSRLAETPNTLVSGCLSSPSLPIARCIMPALEATAAVNHSRGPVGGCLRRAAGRPWAPPLNEVGHM